MQNLKLVGLSIAAALALGLGSGTNAAPLINSQDAVGEFGVADGLVVEVQTLGMERRHNRRMDRQDRRVDRQINRQERRMDRHDRRM